MNDDEIPRRPPPSAHRLGEPLDDLSVEEIGRRVELLRAEIARLEAARTAKRDALEAAGSFFKR